MPHLLSTHHCPSPEEDLLVSEGQRGAGHNSLECLLVILRIHQHSAMPAMLPLPVPAQPHSQPFQVIIMFFLIWLYHQDYRGALLLSKLIHHQVNHMPSLAKNVCLMYVLIHTALVISPSCICSRINPHSQSLSMHLQNPSRIDLHQLVVIINQ